jgi:WD40 repeat protein
MRGVRECSAILLGFLSFVPLLAAADPIVGERAPVLRLEAGGPTAQVTSMAFSPDGKSLYVAGLDKVVRVWSRDAKDRRFEPVNAYRVPLGPGIDGALNAVAVSPDGKWMATGGNGAKRLTAGLREPGLVWLPSTGALSKEMQQDQGTIYLFNTIDGTVRRLRGHTGTIWSLQFVQGANAPILASAAKKRVAGEEQYQAELKLWNVESGKELGDAPTDKMPSVQAGEPLGLAAWFGGGNTRVALAAGDGRIRLWDVKAGKVVEAADETRNTLSLYLPDSKRLLTSTPIRTAGGWRARLRTYNTEDGGLTEINSWTKGEGTSIFWPQALAAITSEAGKVEYIAAVCREDWKDKGETKSQFWLSLFNPADGKIVHEQYLWDIPSGFLEQPVLAVGPHGRHLAVAGNPQHTVYVFAVDDLVARKKGPYYQEFHSVGTTASLVRWAKKDGEQGLSLRTAGGAEQVFEFLEKPRLTRSAAGWSVLRAPKVPEADLDLWSKRHSDARITSAAILPAGSLLKDRRLLAVGYFRGGDPTLGLYDADSGDQVRELTGHLGAITSLAFSEDGKRLASASEDQTVSLWDLADVPDLLTQRGMLRGLIAVDRTGQKGQLVTGVEKGSSAAAKLRVDDVISGIVEKTKLRTYDTARDFYVALSERKPGDTVTLRLVDGKNVNLILDPGIDERKPLFSLFVTRDQDWIGWSPMGAYESSGLKAESYIGWHIGTDKPDRPTAFALAKEYHKEYHKDGALRELLRDGKVAPPKPVPPPKPRMTLWIGEPDAGPADRDAQGRYVLKRRKATLHLQLEEFPRELIDSITWQMDEGKPGTLTPAADQDWIADLGAQMDEMRSDRVARVALKTRGDDARIYPAEIGFRYEPLPPVLTLTKAGGKKPEIGDGPIHLESTAAAFALEVEAAPGLAGEKAAVRLSHTVRGKAASPVQTWDAADRIKLSPRLTLAQGLNVIEIVAANKGAPAGDGAESKRLVLHVDFKPDPVQILLREVVPLLDGAPKRLDGKAGETVVVHSPRVRVSGLVVTRGNPQARWQIGKDKPVALTLEKDRTFSVELPKLKPGTQDFTFHASTEGVNKDSAVLNIHFAPLPPTVTLTEPEAVNEGEHKGDVIIRGKVEIPKGSEGYKYDSTVLLKGERLPGAKVEIDEKEQKITVRAPLKPGNAYSIEVHLSNEWEQTTRSNAVLARYWSPPTAIQFAKVPSPVRKPLIDMRATVFSRLPLTRTEARVQSGTGEETPVSQIRTELGEAEKNTWIVTLKDVPLTQGRNVVRLSAANEQGQSAKPGEIAVQYKEPTEPPTVKILGPTSDKVQTRDYELKFSVRSKAPLQLVAIIQGEKTNPIEREVGKIAANDEGIYELKETVKVKLQAGTNVLKVTAVNDGGRSLASLEVNCVPIPVRMELDAMLSPEGRAIDVRREANGALVAPQAPAPRLTVKGRVIWDDPNDPLLSRKNQLVRVFVNGFQQRPAELQPPIDGKAERTFVTDILLNRSANNRIEFELPNLKRNNESRPVVEVAKCEGFKQDQWLHLLIIGAGEEKRDALLDNVLKAMNARKEKETWCTDVFSYIKTYGPLTKADHNLGPEYIRNQLFTIRETMRLRQAAGAGDIVLIYFKGGELIDKEKGHLLLTGDQADMSLPSTQLAEFFTNSRGANLLFLDVERPGRTSGGVDQFKDWKDESNVSRVGVFRSGQQTKTSPGDGSAARLDRALQEEMPKAQALGQLENGLRAKYKSMEKQFPELGEMSYFYIYPLLEDLVINRKSTR